MTNGYSLRELFRGGKTGGFFDILALVSLGTALYWGEAGRRGWVNFDDCSTMIPQRTDFFFG